MVIATMIVVTTVTIVVTTEVTTAGTTAATTGAVNTRIATHPIGSVPGSAWRRAGDAIEEVGAAARPDHLRRHQEFTYVIAVTASGWRDGRDRLLAVGRSAR